MANLVRIALVGTMPSGEEWSVNPVFRLNTPTSVSYTDAVAIATAIEGMTYPTTLAALHSSTVKLSGVRVEARDNDGTLEALADRTFSIPFSGTGTSYHPFQTSCVFSLRTPGPGGSGRGRVYWPATGASLDSSTLRISSTITTNALTGFRTLMEAIEGYITAQVGEAILAVWSRKLETTFGVTSIQVGDVADTQRRRRDAVPETYTVLAYPT